MVQDAHRVTEVLARVGQRDAVDVGLMEAHVAQATHLVSRRCEAGRRRLNAVQQADMGCDMLRDPSGTRTQLKAFAVLLCVQWENRKERIESVQSIRLIG